MVIKILYPSSSTLISKLGEKYSNKLLHNAQWSTPCSRKLQAFMSTSSINTNGQNFSNNESFDLIVVGGGIVGVTTARAMLIEKPNLKVAILEKEKDVAMHQSGHNSGVIHAGIYYAPGSMKAKFCVEGARQTFAFCDLHKIPYKKCGKLIVATNAFEVGNLMRLYDNALKNRVPGAELVEQKQIRDIEPYCQGLRAIYSPNTGIIDWAEFTRRCAEDFQRKGGKLFCNFKVTKVNEAEKGSPDVDVSQAPIEFHDESRGKIVRSKFAIFCGGLYSDKLAELVDGLPDPRIVPFRGEYLELKEDKRFLVKGNIYPVPDARFPFLGVHFTPRMDGRILVGPNAVLAFSREGYSWDQINSAELKEIIAFHGFQKLMREYFNFGVREMIKSKFISLRVKELQKYIPGLQTNDLEFKNFTGVRAQALDYNGLLVDDMVLQVGSKGIESRILHCRNAPSPSATSSLALSEFIAKSAIVEFDFDA
ncbi:L-2-hydroxyglutarate dehydrogenase, mitochondrial [Planococcus citri]|uniref:L-2-hydroxyglutarate dehydrogenase, mitochondrial n=1 Tax=Planococcus citri TaxID=170843 RepID=UPI0031F734B0